MANERHLAADPPSRPLAIRSVLGKAGDWAPIVASAALAVIVYAITLRGTYIYDDIYIIRTDPRVLEPSQWHLLWTKPYFINAVDKLYRPLTSMSFALEDYLHGDRPWIFHLINILLHAGVSAAVAMLGIRLGGRACAWIAGCLFAVHPVHVEAVAGLVGRAESACALAICIGLLLFLIPRQMSLRRGAAIWACFVIAVLVKEQGILFPILLLVAAPIRYPRGIPGPERAGLKWFGVVMGWTLIFYFLWREHVASFSWDRTYLGLYVNPMVRSTGWDRVLMPLVLLGRYVRLLVFPTRQSIDYGGSIIGWQASPHDPYLYVGAATAAIVVALLVMAWRGRKYSMLFCLLALGLSYGMVGNVVAMIGTIFADRLMYLPSIFALLLAGLALANLPAAAWTIILVVLASLASWRTCTYAWQWNDPLRLYPPMLQNYPRAERAYVLLFQEYQGRGQWEAALRIADRARQAIPDRWEPCVMQIECNLAMGRFDAAKAADEDGLRYTQHGAKNVFLEWRDIIAQKQEAAAEH